MEKIVKELPKIFQFKDTTREGDIVLIVADHLFYALVTGIQRDESKRDDWWHVRMRILAVPPQEVVWTLREPQFTGKEIFTMAGEKRFIKAVDFTGPAAAGPGARKVAAPGQSGKRPVLKVIK